MQNLKILSVFIFVVLLCLINLTQGEIFRVDDVTVETKTSNFRCDRIVCPSNTHRCVVIKKSKSKDLTKVKRKNICYSSNNAVLQKSKTVEIVNDGKQVYFHLDVEHNGKVNTLTWDKPSKWQTIKKAVVDKVKSNLKKN
ncbi:uncharacterized protein [Musca autumnalis]|uniref:uncharacterized protein n=1 Tax=Musca autumnalis TaxID=221902 RepID=UPI003CEA45E5